MRDPLTMHGISITCFYVAQWQGLTVSVRGITIGIPRNNKNLFQSTEHTKIKSEHLRIPLLETTTATMYRLKSCFLTVSS